MADVHRCTNERALTLEHAQQRASLSSAAASSRGERLVNCCQGYSVAAEDVTYNMKLLLISSLHAEFLHYSYVL
jgi:hypothetical protein